MVFVLLWDYALFSRIYAPIPTQTYIFNRCFSLLKSKHLLTKRHVLG